MRNPKFDKADRLVGDNYVTNFKNIFKFNDNSSKGIKMKIACNSCKKSLPTDKC